MALALKSSKNAALYDYYTSLPTDQHAPRYAHFDIGSVREQLPYVYMSRLVRQGAEQRFRFHMIGDKLVAFFKQEGRGRFIREMRLGGWELEWRRSQLLSLEKRKPIVVESVVQDDKVRVGLEHLALPLSDYHDHIIYMAGAIDILDYAEADAARIEAGFTWQNLVYFDIVRRSPMGESEADASAGTASAP